MNTKVIDHFIEFEGDVPHFYLDGAGLVTIGIGTRVFSAYDAGKLAMRFKRGDDLAPVSNKVVEFENTKRAKVNQPVHYYNEITTLYLPTEVRKEMFLTRLQGFYFGLNDKVCKLTEFPETVQLVLLDMAFNLGVQGLVEKFPNFLNAIMQRDYKKAAAESQRKGIQESRNIWTREILLAESEVR